jgi:hypothetical protein
LFRDVAKCRSVDVSRAGSGGCGGSTDVDLDVLVGGDGLCPVVPEWYVSSVSDVAPGMQLPLAEVPSLCVFQDAELRWR